MENQSEDNLINDLFDDTFDLTDNRDKKNIDTSEIKKDFDEGWDDIININVKSGEEKQKEIDKKKEDEKLKQEKLRKIQLEKLRNEKLNKQKKNKKKNKKPVLKTKSKIIDEFDKDYDDTYDDYYI
jgi:hypothetical protein